MVNGKTTPSALACKLLAHARKALEHFDAAGRLWATEFGERTADELNLIRPGLNYGWPRHEGRESDGVNVLEYLHSQYGWGTITAVASGTSGVNSRSEAIHLNIQCTAPPARSRPAPRISTVRPWVPWPLERGQAGSC